MGDEMRQAIRDILESLADSDKFSKNQFSDTTIILYYLKDRNIEASLEDINEVCNELSGIGILQKRLTVNHKTGEVFSEFRFNKNQRR